MQKIIVIPARLSSSRLPNKLLLDLHGKTILQRVYEQCIKVENVKVYIATDSIKIKKSCLDYTKDVIMTSVNHKSGTDRITEAVNDLDFDCLVNVQGDEPFINPKLIEDLFKHLEAEEVQVVTPCERLFSSADLFDSNCVKVVKNHNNYALYFSRSCIPFIRDRDMLLKDEKSFFDNYNFYKHIGIYGFKKKFIKKYPLLNFSNVEKLEKLEQLRILENGYNIKVIETNFKSLGIDTKIDYEKALKILNNKL